MTKSTIKSVTVTQGEWFVTLYLYSDKSYNIIVETEGVSSEMSGEGYHEKMLDDDFNLIEGNEIGIVELENGHRNVCVRTA